MVRTSLVAGALVVVAVAGCRTAPDPTVPLADVAARAAHTATRLDDGRVLVAGGCVTDGCTTASRDTFVVAADGRSAVAGPAMAAPRDNHTAVALPDGRVVVAGGFTGEGAPVSGRVDVLDPAGGRIDAAPSLHQPRGGHAAALLPGGRVLVVGGSIAPQTSTASAEVIDARRGTVQPAADLPWAADALDAVRLADGRVLVTGGRTAAGGTTAAAMFDPATGRWTRVGPMATPRFKHTSVLLADGRVLVIGGTTDDRRILDSTELFDPRTGDFSPGPALHTPRYKLPGGAAVLGDGRVLVGGGAATVEVLDVDRVTSSPVATAGPSGSFATVTALRGDR